MALLTDSLADGINNNGIKVLLDGFAVAFFDGAVPAKASDAVTGNTLAIFTVNNDGVTGGTWDTSANRILARLPSEAMSGTCLVGGSPTFYRTYVLGESPTTLSSVFHRVQGTCGTVNSDAILDTTFFPMVLTTVYPLGNEVFEL